MLDDRIKSVSRMAYNPYQPIDLVFNALDNLSTYAELAHIPLTAPQIINKAFNIMLRSGHFKDALRKWKRLPVNQQTWDEFKIFFRPAHQELRETTDLSVEEAQRQEQQANLVAQVVEGIQNVMRQQPQSETPHQENDATQSQQCMPVNEPTAAAYNVTGVVPNLMQQMQQSHMDQMTALIAKMNTGNNQYRPGKKRKRTVSKYCWTHGACAHSSRECRSKATGHKDDATFENRMGGSTRFLPRE